MDSGWILGRADRDAGVLMEYVPGQPKGTCTYDRGTYTDTYRYTQSKQGRPQLTSCDRFIHTHLETCCGFPCTHVRICVRCGSSAAWYVCTSICPPVGREGRLNRRGIAKSCKSINRAFGRSVRVLHVSSCRCRSVWRPIVLGGAPRPRFAHLRRGDSGGRGARGASSQEPGPRHQVQGHARGTDRRDGRRTAGTLASWADAPTGRRGPRWLTRRC